MNEPSKIKLGIIGAGRMGITHYSIINSHPAIDVIAVADPSSLVLSMMKKYLGVKTYTDFDILLSETKPDALLVCTPPNFHYSIIKKASEAGVHVFAEKPFTTKFNEAAELAALYNKSGLVNQVGYVNRFNDVFLKVKEFVKAGVLGKVIRFKSEMFSCTVVKPEEGSNWRAIRENGGGVVYEMASHAIDLINFIFGKPDNVTGSLLNSIYSKNVEDTVSSTFGYRAGLCGTLYVNWSDTSYRKPTNKIEIFGSSGRLIADQHSLRIFLNDDNEILKLRKGWNTLFITDLFKPVPFYVRGNEFTRQLYHFAECIQDRDKVNACTFIDAANTLEIIEDIFTDYEKNGKII